MVKLDRLTRSVRDLGTLVEDYFSSGQYTLFLLIGAPDANYPGSWPGDDYTSGSATGAAMLVLGPLSSALDLVDTDGWIQGIEIDNDATCVETGASVAGAGDTNGHGFDDILVGDPEYYYNDGYDDDLNDGVGPALKTLPPRPLGPPGSAASSGRPGCRRQPRAPSRGLERCESPTT